MSRFDDFTADERAKSVKDHVFNMGKASLLECVKDGDTFAIPMITTVLQGGIFASPIMMDLLHSYGHRVYDDCVFRCFRPRQV